MSQTVRSTPLWVVTLLMSALLIVGAFISYDKGAAQMFAVLGGVTLPLIAALHSIDD